MELARVVGDIGSGRPAGIGARARVTVPRPDWTDLLMLGVRERSDGGGLLSEPVGIGGGAIADCGVFAPAAVAIRCVWSAGRGG